MHFLYNNMAAIVLAVAASTIAWVFGGTRGELLPPVVPWLVVFVIELSFCFPERREDETTHEARARVWRGLKRDPVLWIAIGLFVLLLIPFVNKGLCPLCDFAKIRQGFDPNPSFTFLPFCVNRLNHLNVVLWFALALSSMVSARHCLQDTGKRLMLELIVWNGVALALLGFIQNAMGAPGPFWQALPNGKSAAEFFSTFGYPNMAGDYFTTLFCLSAALWRWRHEIVRQKFISDHEHKTKNARKLFAQQNFMLIPTVLFFFAALNTLSRAAMLLVTSAAILFIAHTYWSFLARLSRVRKLKGGVWGLIAIGLIIFSATLFTPEKMQREMDTIDSMAVLDRVTGRGQYHTRVATEIWKDNRLFGCGGWGYVHFCIPKMTPAERKHIQMVGGINVHNDYLQFLAEHGLVGFGLMVVLVIMLLAPVAASWHRAARAARFSKVKNLPRPVQIFVMPAPAVFILVGLLASFIHGFGDCPFRSPAVLDLFFLSLVAVTGFLPKLSTTEN